MNFLSEMSWPEIEEYLRHDDRIVLPLGAVEPHGRHLGMGTDFLEAEAIVRGLGLQTEAMIAPVMNYGMSLPMALFPGTLSLKPTTLIFVLIDLLQGLYSHGFRRVLVMNGHGGNHASIVNAVNQVAGDLPELRIKIFEWWKDDEISALIDKTLGVQQGSHASDAETSFMMAIAPQAVKMANLSGKDAVVDKSIEVETTRVFAKHYPDGIMGLNPVKANVEAGLLILNKSVEICKREIENW